MSQFPQKDLKQIKAQEAVKRQAGQLALTDEQVDYVYTTGKDLLVSASAGAGKTHSTVQRIIHLLELGANIDELFISTFTVKAASELKARIEKELRSKIKATSDSQIRKHLSHQLPRLATADIGTMDAFANRLVGEFGYRQGIPAAYRILQDEAEKDSLKDEIFKEIFKKYNTDRASKADFHRLIKAYTGSAKSNFAFKQVVFAIYNYAQASPDPADWLAHHFMDENLYQTQSYHPQNAKGDILASIQLKKSDYLNQKAGILAALDRKSMADFKAGFQAIAWSKPKIKNLTALFEAYGNLDKSESDVTSSELEAAKADVEGLERRYQEVLNKSKKAKFDQQIEQLYGMRNKLLDYLAQGKVVEFIHKFLDVGLSATNQAKFKGIHALIDNYRGCEYDFTDFETAYLVSDVKAMVEDVFNQLLIEIDKLTDRFAALEEESQAFVNDLLDTKTIEGHLSLVTKEEKVKILGDYYELHDFYNLVEVILAQQPKALEILPVLRDFVTDFTQAYLSRKLRDGLLEFADVAHFAISLLKDKDGELAKEYQHRYLEVMVDEYQDNSRIQEELLNLLAGKLPDYQLLDEYGKAKFIARSSVGDIKQSIYSFRQAEPDLFRTTLETYAKDMAENGAAATSQVIILAENFRSSKEVIDATNMVFSHLMDEQLGDINYDDTQMLAQLAGASKAESHPELKTQYLIYDTEGEEAELDDVTVEAALPSGQVSLVIKEIQDLMNQSQADYEAAVSDLLTKTDLSDEEKKQLDEAEAKRLHYKDFVLLVPSRSSNDEILAQFDRYKLPLAADDGVSHYLDAMEVINMLNVLKAIENPFNDPALFATINSPLFDFNEDELARIALQKDFGPLFYQKLTGIASKTFKDETGLITADLRDKVTFFVKYLEELARFSRQHSVHDLIWKLYNERYYLAYAQSLDSFYGTDQRKANLLALAERAEGYEVSGYKGLTRFINMISRIMASEHDLADVQTELPQDAVRLMTIHKSKGLEFKYVFVLNMQGRFNLMDTTHSKVIMDTEKGVGTRLILDMKEELVAGEHAQSYPFERLNVEIETIPYMENRDKVRNRLISERMRLLYVAMTRAECKLYLVGSGAQTKLEAKYQGLSTDSELVLPVAIRRKITNFQDWFLAIRAAYPDEFATHIDLKYLSGQQAQPSPAKVVEAKRDIQKDNRQSDLMAKMIKDLTSVADYNQAHQAAIELKTVRTPSQMEEVKPIEAVTEVAPQASTFRPFNFKLFDLADQATDYKPTAAEIGSLTHELMELIDLTQPVTQSALTSILERLTPHAVARAAVPLDLIVDFYQKTELGQYLIEHQAQLKREVPFAMLDKLVLENQSYDAIIRGIVDGFVLEADRIILFDYKTNSYEDEAGLQQILASYQKQQDRYAQALSQAYGVKNIEKYLILLGGETIRVERLN